MDGVAVTFVLADTASALTRFVDVFFTVYTLLILAYILLSWFRLPYSPTLDTVRRFLHDACNPYLRLFRRVIPPLGPIDVSPIVAIVVLGVLRTVVVRALEKL